MNGVVALDSLIGLSVDEAKKRLEPLGITLRVTCIDGRHQMVTEDYDTTRLNVWINSGKLIRLGEFG